MINQNDFNSFSTRILADEARRRGIKVTKIFPETNKSFIRLEFPDGRVETIIGQRISSMSYNASFACRHKELARRLLNSNGIKTTEGNCFSYKSVREAIDYASLIGFPIVVKPVDATWGSHVYLNINSEDSALIAIEKIINSGKTEFLIEKQFFGKEYRILATREKLLGVINRIPANVTGDGIHTIEQLIEIKNNDPRRGSSHEKSLVRIKIDADIVNCLAKEDLKLSSVPTKGVLIYLRHNSNLSTGGDSYDVTDEIHPNVWKLAPRVIASIPGLPYGGFDFLTPDITKDPFEVGYAIIEINDSPMISMHHFPYQGKERDVAKEIIDLLFQ